MFNPLKGWLDRRQPIPERFYTLGHIDVPTPDWPCWISIEECKPLHLVMGMQWLSLKDGRANAQSYLDSASELIRRIA